MKIGVIGAAGKIGRMRVRSVLENANTSLVAVMDLNIEAANAVAPGVAAFTDAQSFFNTEMDAVIISTPAFSREEFCLEAFARGLHVLAEKPLTISAESSRRIVDAAVKADRALGAGFNMRYYRAFRLAYDVAQSGEIGEIDHVRIYGGHEGLPKFVHDWEYKSEVSGGGALWDVGIHMTDMARHVLGEVVKVYGVATENVWKQQGSEDNAMALFTSPSGVTATYHASWIDWKGYKSVIEIYGSHGMIRGAYAPMENNLIKMDRPGGKTTRKRYRYPGLILTEKLKGWQTTAYASFSEELAEFLDLASGKTGLRIADGHAGLRAIEIADAVKQSSKSGMPVELTNLGDMAPVGMSKSTIGDLRNAV